MKASCRSAPGQSGNPGASATSTPQNRRPRGATPADPPGRRPVRRGQRATRADATERPVVQQLKAEKDIAAYGRSCPTFPPNSLPTGTKVLMGDGSTRAGGTGTAGDLVTGAGPGRGPGGPLSPASAAA